MHGVLGGITGRGTVCAIPSSDGRNGTGGGYADESRRGSGSWGCSMADMIASAASQVMAAEPSAAGVLLHLLRLSHEVAARPGVWAVAVYAETQPDGTTAILDERLAAETGFEGVACVDDVARAALLALRLYELEAETVALKIAERWLSFLDYMQLPDGRMVNFILGWTGRRNETGATSQAGGAFWTARTIHALGAAYRTTGNQHYKLAFERAWPSTLPDGTDVAALLLLGALDYLKVTADTRIEHDARRLADLIASTTVDGYLVHHPGEAEVHMWAYDQVTALVEAARHFERPDYLDICEATAVTVFQRNAHDGPFRGYPSRETAGVCAYDVSCCCRGLAALYEATGKQRYMGWLQRLIAWFDLDNPAGRPVYIRDEGRCHDGIEGTHLNANCGAESAIEAGFVELLRRRFCPRMHAVEVIPPGASAVGTA